MATYFERRMPDRDSIAPILAHHWKEAGDPDRAVGYLLWRPPSARCATWADAEAVALYEEALSLIPTEEEARRRTIGMQRSVAWFRYEHSIDGRGDTAARGPRRSRPSS